MIISFIQQKHKKNIRDHSLIMVALLGLYISMLMTFKDQTEIIHWIGLVLFTLLLMSFMLQMRRIKHALRDKKIKVTHTTHTFPYPQKFTDNLVDVGGFFKRYLHKKHLIPDYLIEFREGRMLYLYPIVTDANDDVYTILRVHHFSLALVIDQERKKRILHLGNATLLN